MWISRWPTTQKITHVCMVWGESGENSKKDAGRAKLLKGAKSRQIGNPFQSSKYGVYAKAIRKLQPAGEIAIRFPTVGRSGNAMAIGPHCDDGGILTKGGSKSHIAHCGFLRENAHR